MQRAQHPAAITRCVYCLLWFALNHRLSVCTII